VLGHYALRGWFRRNCTCVQFHEVTLYGKWRKDRRFYRSKGFKGANSANTSELAERPLKEWPRDEPSSD